MKKKGWWRKVLKFIFPSIQIRQIIRNQVQRANLKEFQKDAFCSPALVELKDGKVVTLHSELPEGAVMVDKKVSKEALKEWTLKAKEKWKKSN